MKDGRIITGAIHPMKSVIELPMETDRKKESSLIQTEKILLIDDGLRRIFVPKNNVLDLVPDEVGASAETFFLPQRTDRNPKHQLAILGAFRQSTPFDEFGRRTIMVGGQPLVQAITTISPKYVRVEGLNYNNDMRVSPYSIPRETLSNLVRRQINPKSLDDRLRLYQFYVQAELYEQAATELQEIITDFQKDNANESRLQTGLQLIRQLAAQRIVDELVLRRRAGQFEQVREMLHAFESQEVSADKLQEIRRMSQECEEIDKRRDQIIAQLEPLFEKIQDESIKASVEPILNEIRRELNHNTLDRFTEFLLILQDTKLSGDAKLAIGLSSWIAGNEGLDNRLEMAASMYRVRRLIRRYFLETLAIRRDALWEEIRKEEATSPERIARIIARMKPPQSTPASRRESPGFYEIEVPSFDGTPIQYCVQLPPEYEHNRKYPAVITLHGLRTTPQMQLDWWCGSWQRTTNADNTVSAQRYGQASRNGYIVIAPQWTQTGRPYTYSAREHAAVLIAMRDALKRFSINTDQVFLSGHGCGGDATWDLGLAHPDLWAGIIPICGAATKFPAILKRNAQYVPVYAIGGELDGGKLNLSQEVLDWGMDMSKPFDMTYVQFQGRGNESFSDELVRIFEWMDLRKRDFFSKEERQVYSVRRWDHFFWSVELWSFPVSAMIDPDFWTSGKPGIERPAKTEFFKITGNSMKIKSSASSATVCLSPEQLDFGQKAEVMYNMAKLTPQNGLIVPSVRVILEDVRTRCDRQHPFWATLHSDRPGKFNLIEGK
ncbi:MAG: hypothetical protein Q4G59_00875 [Planctomycetia bacterium]|nr:hypothetical protein [Planctomycetia bacterium]